MRGHRAQGLTWPRWLLPLQLKSWALWRQAGCEGAVPEPPPARSHLSSASPTGQLRMWTIYTGRGGRRLEGQATRSPYVGMTNGSLACQGTRAQNHASALGVLQLHQVPTDPHLPPPCDRLWGSCLLPFLLFKNTLGHCPSCPSAALQVHGGHIRALMPALSPAPPRWPHGRGPAFSTGRSSGCLPSGWDRPVTFLLGTGAAAFLSFAASLDWTPGAWAASLCPVSPALTVRHSWPNPLPLRGRRQTWPETQLGI